MRRTGTAIVLGTPLKPFHEGLVLLRQAAGLPVGKAVVVGRMLEKGGGVGKAELLKPGGYLGERVLVGLEHLEEAPAGLFRLQRYLADYLVPVVHARLPQKDVGGFGKHAALHLAARAVQVAGHGLLVRLQAGDDRLHPVHRHREPGNVVGDEALACGVGQVPLVLRNLVHVEGEHAGAHGLPEGLHVLAVPGVALLRHGGRSHLGRGEVFEDLPYLAPLQVAQVVGKVRDDAEGDVELQKEAEQVFRLDELEYHFLTFSRDSL